MAWSTGCKAGSSELARAVELLSEWTADAITTWAVSSSEQLTQGNKWPQLNWNWGPTLISSKLTLGGKSEPENRTWTTCECPTGKHHACAPDRLWRVSQGLPKVPPAAWAEWGEPGGAGEQDGEAVEAVRGDGGGGAGLGGTAGPVSGRALGTFGSFCYRPGGWDHREPQQDDPKSSGGDTSLLDFIPHLNFTLSLLQVTKFQNILLDQANKCISKNLTVFLREDMKQMKETKGYFNKISNDLDSALSKNAAASKCRPGDIEDARWISNNTFNSDISVYIQNYKWKC